MEFIIYLYNVYKVKAYFILLYSVKLSLSGDIQNKNFTILSSSLV